MQNFLYFYLLNLTTWQKGVSLSLKSLNAEMLAATSKGISEGKWASIGQGPQPCAWTNKYSISRRWVNGHSNHWLDRTLFNQVPCWRGDMLYHLHTDLNLASRIIPNWDQLRPTAWRTSAPNLPSPSRKPTDTNMGAISLCEAILTKAIIYQTL